MTLYLVWLLEPVRILPWLMSFQTLCSHPTQHSHGMDSDQNSGKWSIYTYARLIQLTMETVLYSRVDSIRHFYDCELNCMRGKGERERERERELDIVRFGGRDQIANYIVSSRLTQFFRDHDKLCLQTYRVEVTGCTA